MSQSDTLGTLVAQAVHLVEGWQGGDNTALEGLHRVMQHILASLSQLDRSTDQWVTELEKSTSEATTALQHLVEDQTQDVDQAVALIDQVIGFLRQQYKEGPDVSENESEGSDAPAPVIETATEEPTGYLIPEDDIPLILGQTNFFMEFDVCFYRSKLEFEIKPTSP